MQELAKSKMAKGLDFDCKQDFSFCEPCVQGKSHHLPFQQSGVKKTNHLGNQNLYCPCLEHIKYHKSDSSIRDSKDVLNNEQSLDQCKLLQFSDPIF